MSVRERFVQERRPRWDRLEHLLLSGARDATRWSELASLYRGVCADLATGQSLGMPGDVLRYLDDLAGRAHNVLYSLSGRRGVGLVQLVFAEVPREVRRSWPFFAAAFLLFYGPLVIGLVGALLDARFAYAVLPEANLHAMEQMYSTAAGREGGEDAAMAGFYVYNNVGIAFRCFATGIFAGLGPLFYLVYNGLVIGTVAGYLGSVGLGGNLLSFVAGHSAWELTGVVVAGAAGLLMGWALVATHGRTRVGSLAASGRSLYRLVVGATAMLLVAALIEGFWSASPLPDPVKWVFGGLQVLVVTAWLALGGRR